MAKKCTCLCKYDKKYIAEHEEELKQRLRDPQFYCKKCVRVSTHQEDLCKPKKI